MKIRETEPNMRAEDFAAWLRHMKACGLIDSAADAQRMLGISYQTIYNYRKYGAPAHIGLACAALYHNFTPWTEAEYDSKTLRRISPAR